MMRTMAGPERFRAGTDLYFERHDGEAATCEDFVTRDRGRRRARPRRSSAAGTRRRARRRSTVAARARRRHGHAARSRRRCRRRPGQPDKQPMPIPLRLALFDRETGQARAASSWSCSTRPQASFSFAGFAAAAGAVDQPRLLRAGGDRARRRRATTCVFLAAHDDDPFARYEAMQEPRRRPSGRGGRRRRCSAMPTARPGARRSARRSRAVLADPALDDLMRGELMILPGQTLSRRAVAGRRSRRDPCASARRSRAGSGATLEAELAALHDRAQRGALRPATPRRAARASSRPRRWSSSPPGDPREARGAGRGAIRRAPTT